MRVVMCDDDELLLAHEADILRKEWSKDEVITYSDPELMMQELPGLNADVVIMDVELGRNLDGIDYATRINRLLPEVQIIFLSSYAKYSIEAHDADHCYYLIKDDWIAKLPNVRRRVERHRSNIKAEPVKIVVNDVNEREKKLLSEDEVIYISSGQRHLLVYTAKEVIETNEKLDDFMNQLKETKIIRCHQSFAVNISAIAKYNREMLVMNNGDAIPISRKYITEVRDSLFKYASEQTF